MSRLEALRRPQVTDELIRAVEDRAANNPLLYGPDTPREEVETNTLRYIIEHFYLLELIDYTPDSNISHRISEKTPRFRAEKAMWKRLGQEMEAAPVGSTFIALSPREDSSNYPMEIVFFGIKEQESGPSSWQGWQLRLLDFEEKKPPLPLEKYIAMQNALSEPPLPNNASIYDIVHSARVLEPGEASPEYILKIIHAALTTRQIGQVKANMNLERLLSALHSKPAEKLQSRLQKELSRQLDEIYQSIQLGNKRLALERSIFLELEMASRLGYMPAASGCGIACSLATETSSRGKEQSDRGKEGNVKDIQLSEKYCKTCEKSLSRCQCKLKKAA